MIAARLYIETSLGRNVGPVTGALDGPGSAPRPLAATPSNPTSPAKLYEAVAGTGPGAVLRSAVWDVTGFVAAAGAGTYTVADILSQRAGPYLPYASWAMVVAYELDPAVGLDGVADRDRFAPRVLSWHDGFQLVEGGSVDVAVPNVGVRPRDGAVRQEPPRRRRRPVRPDRQPAARRRAARQQQLARRQPGARRSRRR